MNDYLKSNEAFQIALETLKSESTYNVSILEAKEEGREEGLQKGLEQGREEGLQKGKLDNQKETILKMCKKGISKEDIANLLDLDLNTVNEILNN